MSPKISQNRHFEVLDELISQPLTSVQVNVCMGIRSSESNIPEYHRIVATENVVTDFLLVAKKLLDSIGRKRQKGNFQLFEYTSTAMLSSHEIEYFEVAKEKSIATQIAEIESMATFPSFIASDENLSRLKFYVIVIERRNGKPAYFFRTCGSTIELSKSKKIAAFFSGNQFDIVRESLFVFDRGVDCFYVDGFLYIINKGKFEAIFRYFQEVHETAKGTLADIREFVPIANFEEFQETCLGEQNMMRKLKNIACQEYLSSISMEAIETVVKKMKLNIQIVTTEGGKELVFDPSNKWEVLRLLDDDYLQSLLTGESYEVNSKRLRLGQE